MKGKTKVAKSPPAHHFGFDVDACLVDILSSQNQCVYYENMKRCLQKREATIREMLDRQ